MFARIREMEVLVRWATVHWDSLREPLGFDRDKPPCATKISRTLAKCRVEDFQAALNQWLRHHMAETARSACCARQQAVRLRRWINIRVLRRLWLDLENADDIRETPTTPHFNIAERQLTSDGGMKTGIAREPRPFSSHGYYQQRGPLH